MASVSFSFAKPPANWRKSSGGSWTISWTNNTGGPVKLKSFAMRMATGKTNGNLIWSSYGRIGPYSGAAMTVNVSTSAGGSGSVSVSSQVTPGAYGSSTSDTAWFNYAGTWYTVGLGSIFVGSGATVNFTMSVGSSGGVVSIRQSGGYKATIGYDPASYTVTFKDGVTGGTISTKTVNHGGSATPPSAPSHTGYTFTGWSGTYTNVTSNRTITAQYVLTSYTIYLDARGGSVSPGSKTVTYGSPVNTLPTPSRGGYTFAGWFTSASGGSQFTSSTTYWYTSNITLYARWTPINYTITYVSNGATNSPVVMPYNPSSYTKESATFTLNNPTRLGYTFLGWTGNGISTPTLNMTLYSGSTGNKTFTANWRAQLEENSGGTWAKDAVAYKFNGSSWSAIDTKKFNGSSWNKLP